MKVLIVGAGVGGLATAIALRQHGFDVELFEAAPGRSSGGGLGITSNATKVLTALGVDLVTAGVGQVCQRFELRTSTGRPIRELPLRSIADELGSPVVNVRRSDLIAVLRYALAGTPIHDGVPVVRYDQTRAGGGVGVRVTCADGRTHTADVLVGADGIHSVIRAQLAGPQPLNEYGYVCWIATVRLTHPRLGTGGVVHYWGSGQRFGLIDIGYGHTYWWGTKNVKPGSGRLWAGEKEEILRAFAGWASEVREVISHTPQAAIVSVPAQDRPFLERWGAGPVTLVGDAAHPMLTSLSQGAGSAIEDGHTLAHQLATAADPVTGLRQYERARRDRARWLVSASRRLSRLEQVEHPIAVGLRNLALRRLPMSVVRRQNATPMRFEPPA